MFRTTLHSSVSTVYHKMVCATYTLSTKQLRVLRPSAPAAFTSSRLVAYRFLSQEARSQIQNAVESSPLVLFMKGTPQLPECGFSRAVVQVLDLHGVPSEKMKTYNVLADAELRTGIKEFSWVGDSFLLCCPLMLRLVNGQQYPRSTWVASSLVAVILSLVVSRD